MHRILFVIVLILAAAAGCTQANRAADNNGLDLAAIDVGSVSGQLGTFSTKFDPGEEGRDTNIQLASDSISQAVVQPGEEFSFNKTIGPTTEKNGYKLAMIYVNGKKDEGYGGGVCQVSSTLYNAAVKAGMKITERHDHSLPVTYVEAGKEAATSYGVKDLKFINDLSTPIVIHSSVVNGEITVSINNA